MTVKIKSKRFWAWLLFWGCVAAFVWFVGAFPVTSRFVLVGVCAVFLAISTWQLAGSFFDD